jgi:hypothetical protein
MKRPFSFLLHLEKYAPHQEKELADKMPEEHKDIIDKSISKLFFEKIMN